VAGWWCEKREGSKFWLEAFKKAGSDSGLESYSSSPPLEDCILPLLPESITYKKLKQKKGKKIVVIAKLQRRKDNLLKYLRDSAKEPIK
jgi:hypothetical protein